MNYTRLKPNIPFSARLNEWIEKRVESIPHVIDDDAPETLEGMVQKYAQTGKVWVNDKHGLLTIFGNPYTNAMFRVWHDWHHIRYQYELTILGEIATAYSQIRELPHDWHEEKVLLLTEIIGQAWLYSETQVFPDDQRTFTTNILGL